MKNLSRRGFLKSVTAGAAIGFPTIVPATVFGANAPSNRVTTGHIGVGGQGNGLLRGFKGCEEGQCVAACDTFKNRRDKAAASIDGKAYADFRDLLARDDIDAVVIATPDHWHVPLSIAAVKAGKDVYCEKPMGVSVDEDKKLRKTVHRYGAVFQYGTQQRSFNTHCGIACELVRNGYIGELKAIHVVAPNGKTGGNPEPQPVPDELDYDMWLGPAPVTPYTKDRVIGGGRWYIYDYALGFIAGWGAHPLDIAHWGYPHIPVEYEGTGVIPTEGLFDTVVKWDVKGRYASGVEFTLKAGRDSTTFVGTEGWIRASRGGWDAEPKSLLSKRVTPEEEHLLQDNHHYRNFLKSVKTRSTPASNIDSAVQSDIMSHMGDICIRLGRKIHWDPEKETITGDPTAERMLTRALRAPWQI